MSTQSNSIEVLNELIETCKDGEYGFKACAEQADSPELKSMLQSRANECRSGAERLQAKVRELGGNPDTTGTVAGAVHRGWVSVKTTLTSYDDLAVMQECERGEDHALEKYRTALKADLPADVRALVDEQYQGVKRNHDMVRARRDALKAAKG
jgi:uncharacterized protein (TIGR02284 family)